MERLKAICDKCKCGVNLFHNTYKTYYEDVETHLDRMIERENITIGEDFPQELYDKIIETDSFYELHCYQDTPIGFYSFYHYDLDILLDDAYHQICC